MRSFIICCIVSLSALADPRVKIAVLDTGFDSSRTELAPYLCVDGHTSLVDTEPMKDYNQHGTNVAGLISDHINPVTHCILIIKVYAGFGNSAHLAHGIDYAVAKGAQYINISIVGKGESALEYKAIEKAVLAKVHIAAAAGNDTLNLDLGCTQYPACYADRLSGEYFHVVGSNTYLLKDGRYSNFGHVVKYFEDGTHVGLPRITGTSQATAIHTGKWAR